MDDRTGRVEDDGIGRLRAYLPAMITSKLQIHIETLSENDPKTSRIALPHPRL